MYIKLDRTKPDYKVNVVLNCKKANQLGWKKKFSLKQGIEKTFNWINSQIKEK